MRLKSSVALPAASLRIVDAPQGMIIEAAHYPYASRRDYRMFHSEGFVGNLRPGASHTYQHAMSSEPGSSGAGAFEIGVDSVVGVHVAAISGQTTPGQMRSGFPNRVLMLSSDTVDDITEWINESL